MGIFIHFIDEEEHCDIYLLHILVRKVCQSVEELRVLSAKVNRNYVALIFNTLSDECLLPFYIPDIPVAFS